MAGGRAADVGRRSAEGSQGRASAYSAAITLYGKTPAVPATTRSADSSTTGSGSTAFIIAAVSVRYNEA